MKRSGLTTSLVAAVFAALLACSGGLPPEFPAPDFTLKSPVTGKQVVFSELKGRPVIIYWFTSW